MSAQAPWSIRRRLPIVFAGVVGLAVGTLTWTSYVALRARTLDSAEERLERLALEISRGIDSAQARDLRDRLESVAAAPDVVDFLEGRAPEGAARAVLDTAAASMGASTEIALWLPRGELALVTGDGVVDIAPDVPPMMTDVAGLSPLQAADDTTVFYDLVAPVRGDQRTVGLVSVRTRVRDSTADAMEAILGPTGDLLIGNLDGSVWVSGHTRAVPPPAEILDDIGEVVSFARNGSKHMGVTAGLPGTPWVALVEIGSDEVLRPTREYLAQTLTLAVILILLGAAVAWAFGVRLTAPFHALAEAASGIAGGDYTTRVTVEAPLAAARVADAFNAMSEEVQHRTGDLKASENRLLSLVNATSQIVWLSGPDGDVSRDVASWRAYTGQSPEAVTGPGWLEAVHPADRSRFDETWSRAANARGPFEFEARVRGEEGDYRLFTVRGVPVRDLEGAVVEWVGTCTDIEIQRTAERELRRAESELRQAQKMEAVGRLAGGVAHDFNNILTGILAPAHLARAGLEEDHPVANELDEIIAGALKAADLTRQLMTVGRARSLDLAPVDFNDVVRGASKLLQRVIGEQFEIAVALADDLSLVHANRSELEQIILNLAINARDAMPRGGRLTLETRNVELGADYVRKHPSARAGNYVMLAVSDTGMGMSRATIDRIFEPFFTTKKAGEGTGLGLATVHGIVIQSGGHVWVYSEEGHGTTFKVYLPALHDEAAAGEPSAPRQDTVVGGSEVVLLVEDNDAVRQAAKRSLESFGYEVLAAADGPTALELLEARDDVGLVVTDMVMPQMSGAELANELRRRRLGMPVLFLSGYADAAVAGREKLKGDEPFLQKPFTPTALADAVRGVLDG